MNSEDDANHLGDIERLAAQGDTDAMVDAGFAALEVEARNIVAAAQLRREWAAEQEQ